MGTASGIPQDAKGIVVSTVDIHDPDAANLLERHAWIPHQITVQTMEVGVTERMDAFDAFGDSIANMRSVHTLVYPYL